MQILSKSAYGKFAEATSRQQLDAFVIGLKTLSQNTFSEGREREMKQLILDAYVFEMQDARFRLRD